MFHPDELRDPGGRWTKSGLLKHGITMQATGRVRGRPAQAVHLNGLRIGHVQSHGNGRFSAYYGPQARRYDEQRHIGAGYESIAEAAAHIAHEHEGRGVAKQESAVEPDRPPANVSKSSMDRAMARGRKAGDAADKVKQQRLKEGWTVDEHGRLQPPEGIGKMDTPQEAAAKHLAAARDHLARGDHASVQEAKARIAKARAVLPPNAVGRGHVFKAGQASTPRGMRPHIIAAQKALGHPNPNEMTAAEHAAKAQQHTEKAVAAAAKEKPPLMPVGIARMDKGAEYIGRLNNGNTVWGVTHAPPGGAEQDRVYVADKAGDVRLATTGDMAKVREAPAAKPKLGPAELRAKKNELGRSARQAHQGERYNKVGEGAPKREPAQLRAAASGSAGFAKRTNGALNSAQNSLEHALFFHTHGQPEGENANAGRAMSALQKVHLPAGHPAMRQHAQAISAVGRIMDGEKVKPEHHAEAQKAVQNLSGAINKGQGAVKATKDKTQPGGDRVKQLADDVKSGKRDAMDVIGQLIGEGERSAKRDRRNQQAAKQAEHYADPGNRPDAQGFAKFNQALHGSRVQRGHTVKVKGIKGPVLVQKRAYVRGKGDFIWVIKGNDNKLERGNWAYMTKVPLSDVQAIKVKERP